MFDMPSSTQRLLEQIEEQTKEKIMTAPTKSTPYTKSGQELERQNQPNIMQRHRAFFESRLPQITRWVTQGVRAEAIVRYALMEMSTNEKLRECSEQSIYLGLLACAVTGLEPGALKGEAYLVPFKQQAVFIPGWKGLVKQARRTREITGIVANVVREADTFDLDLGTANHVVHKPARHERGDVIGAYAIATMVGGFHEIEWMDRMDLDAIEKVATSRGKSPAWDGWQDQMQRKSVIRRLCKRLPLGADYFVGLALEQAEQQGDIIDIETEGEASRAGQAARTSTVIREQTSPSTRDATLPANGNDQAPYPTEAAPEKPAKKTEQSRGAAQKTERQVGPQGPETDVEAKRASGHTPDSRGKPDPTQRAAPESDIEERSCEMCGTPIAVPKNDPPGGICESCANS